MRTKKNRYGYFNNATISYRIMLRFVSPKPTCRDNKIKANWSNLTVPTTIVWNYFSYFVSATFLLQGILDSSILNSPSGNDRLVDIKLIFADAVFEMTRHIRFQPIALPGPAASALHIVAFAHAWPTVPPLHTQSIKAIQSKHAKIQKNRSTYIYMNKLVITIFLSMTAGFAFRKTSTDDTRLCESEQKFTFPDSWTEKCPLFVLDDLSLGRFVNGLGLLGE